GAVALSPLTHSRRAAGTRYSGRTHHEHYAAEHPQTYALCSSPRYYHPLSSQCFAGSEKKAAGCTQIQRQLSQSRLKTRERRGGRVQVKDSCLCPRIDPKVCPEPGSLDESEGDNLSAAGNERQAKCLSCSPLAVRA